MTRALDVECPTCDARVGEPCRIVDGLIAAREQRGAPYPHPDRIIAARTETMAGLGRQPPTYRGAWRDRR